MSNTQQPAALLKAVTDAFGPDGEATQFDAETWGRIHAAITSTLALNQDLLEACKELSDYVHMEQSSTDGAVTYSNTQIHRLAFLARAAIAKATGGAA